MSTEEKRSQAISVSELIAFARYCSRAVRRHFRVALSCFLAISGIALVISVTMPNRWEVTARILTKRSYIIPSLVSPHRSIPFDSDRPTRGAAETILSYSFREELYDSMKFRQLLEQHQSAYYRLKSKVVTAISGEVEPRLIRMGLIEVLAKAIEVTVIDDRVINIKVKWIHPAVAFQVAQGIVDQYLRTQKAAEIDEIHDTVDIIQRNVARAHSRLTETTTRLTELVRRKETELAGRLSVRETRERRTVSFRRPAAPSPESPDRDERQDQAQRLRTMERELRHLNDQHQQRIARANQNLKRLEESLGPRHPDLQAARREVEDARPVPDEINKLKAGIAALRAQLPGAEAHTGSTRFEVVQMPLSEDVFAALQSDPEVAHMMEEARKWATEYESQLDRLEAAELEIDMANAAFAYRYTVTQPPVYPIEPASSKRKMVLAAGVFFAALLALGVCVLRDLADGRIRARWQVERLLGLPVLGQVRLDD